MQRSTQAFSADSAAKAGHELGKRRFDFDSKAGPTESSNRIKRLSAPLVMRFLVDPEFDALFAESLKEFLACALSSEGIEGTRASHFPGEEWLVECHFNNSAIRRKFTASQAYRRSIRLLCEFIIQA